MSNLPNPLPPFEFMANNKEMIRCEVRDLPTYKGGTHRIVSIRKFFPDITNGRWLPSKQGIALNHERLSDLHRALRALLETE